MSEAVTQEQEETLVIKVEDKEFVFSYPKNTPESSLSQILLHMRDHVMYVVKIQHQQKALQEAKEEKEKEEAKTSN